MAQYALDAVEIFGKGVLKAEGVVVDKEGNVYGGGRNGVIYKVSPEGTVSELTALPAGSLPNGITMDRNGDLVYCDLGKKAMMRITPSGQVSMIADRVGTLPLTLPNFASYDAEGNLYVSNSSTREVKRVREEFAKPEPNGALVRIRPDGRGEI
jgi:gluconolactonase